MRQADMSQATEGAEIQTTSLYGKEGKSDETRRLFPAEKTWIVNHSFPGAPLHL